MFKTSVENGGWNNEREKHQKSSSKFKEGKGDSKEEGSAEEPSASKTTVYNKVRKCYRCESLNHLANSCTSPSKEITCFLCKQSGHIASRCEKVNFKKEKSNNDNEINLVLSANSNDLNIDKFIREIEINNSKVNALIDMGATVCTVKASVVLNENFNMIREKSKLGGFGNSEVWSSGTVTEIVKLENLNPKLITFKVVPDTAQIFDVILGRSYTEALDICYERVGHNLYFKNIDPSIFDKENESKNKIYSKDNVQINAVSINFINILSNDKEFILPVSNLSEKKINVKAGQKIGGTLYMINEKLTILENRVKTIDSSEIKTNPDITPNQKQQLTDILNRYTHCIADNIFELGCTDVLKMNIELKEGAEPFQAKPYRLNSEDSKDLDKIVTEWKAAGIASETKAEFASPVFLARKKDGSPRLIPNYRKLNKITKEYNFPIPNFEDFFR